MKILVINSGSSSIKYQLIVMPGGGLLVAGSLERIGEPDGCRHVRQTDSGDEETAAQGIKDHRDALKHIITSLSSSRLVTNPSDLYAIGHRVVHGGERFQQPVRINSTVIAQIREMIPLAPLHNPANLLGIEGCLNLFPDVPQIAVFDTAFHQTIPEHAYRYAVPNELYTEHNVRRYGFHGTSHAYVAKRAAQYLARPLEQLNLISMHLGNGASAAAIAGGRSVDTSMGMTPLEGLVMGTRCGDIDPALVFYISRVTNQDISEVETLLNNNSGLKGLCGVNDMREVIDHAESGDSNAQLALSIFCYRIRKYTGAYIAVLGQLDALIFTAGIGENSQMVRKLACDGLEGMGIKLDRERNEAVMNEVTEIQSDSAAVKILVIPTNEELEIATQALQLLQC